jgi:hypothetical protein
VFGTTLWASVVSRGLVVFLVFDIIIIWCIVKFVVWELDHQLACPIQLYYSFLLELKNQDTEFDC